MKKNILPLLISIFYLYPTVLLAADPFGLFEAARYSLPTGKPPLSLVIVMIINTILSVIGVVVLIVIIYGGFQWMTAAGNEEKVSKAKQILTGAIIGLVIVMASLAIVKFVIGNITKSLGPVSEQPATATCLEVGQACDQNNPPYCCAGQFACSPTLGDYLCAE